MGLINSDLPSILSCGALCSAEDLPNPITTSCNTINTTKEEVIFLFFNCNTTLTNNWATAADIITDLTPVAPATVGNAVGAVLRWDGKTKKERTEITRGSGSFFNSIAGAWRQNFETYYDFRTTTQDEYVFFNQLILAGQNAQLNFAYITGDDEIYFYRTQTSLLQSDDVAEIDGFEHINISIQAKGNGEGMTQPIYISGLYNAIKAVL